MLLVLISTFVFSFAHTDHNFSHLPIGGRKALHGMVVFGSGPYFLEHIPMLTPPHDFQIITEVVLKNKNGSLINQNFSNKGFTLKPSSSFSLNDYVAGRLQVFTGSIFQGSFEQNGRMVPSLDEVTVQVKSYKVIRQLPGSSTSETLIQLSDGKSTFESNVIRPQQNFQMIRNVKTGEVLWCVKAPDFFESCK
jgi:hypothetical protein